MGREDGMFKIRASGDRMLGHFHVRIARMSNSRTGIHDLIIGKLMTIVKI
jgi:hypothetical protein